MDRLKFWQERVENSNGQSLFVPDALQEEYNRLQEVRERVRQENVKISAEVARLNCAFQNFWLKVQEHLAQNGHPDIWVKDLGEDEGALSDGIGVINIMKGRV